jgi:hypothetical protein
MKIFSPQITGSLQVGGNTTITGSITYLDNLVTRTLSSNGISSGGYNAGVVYTIQGGSAGGAGVVITGDGAGTDNSVKVIKGTGVILEGNTQVTGSAVITGSLIVQGPQGTSTSGAAVINGILNANHLAIPGYGSINIGFSGSTRNYTTGQLAGAGPGIVVGYGNGTEATDGNSSIVFGKNNTQNVFMANGSNNMIFGISNALNNGNATTNNVLIGTSNVIDGNGTHNVLAGNSHQTTTGADNGGAFAGFNHTISHDRSVVIGGQNITTAAADTVYVPNLVSSGSIVTGNPSTSTALGARSAVIGGNNNDIAATADNSAIVGGENNVINSGEINSVILGGQANIMTSARGAIIASLSSSILGDSAGVIVGGQNNTTNTGYYQGIVAGQSNTATGIQSFIGGGQSNSVSGNASVILGGTSNTNTHTNSSIIAGNGMTSRADNTAHAQNLIVTTLTTLSGSLIVSGSSTFLQSTVLSGSIRGEVNALSIASNTASLNCALDNFFTLQLVSGSNTFINPSNILPGQTINLRINTTGSATVSFPSSVLQVSGSSYVPTTTTGVDVVTFISFDSTSLLLSNVKNLV